MPGNKVDPGGIFDLPQTGRRTTKNFEVLIHDPTNQTNQSYNRASNPLLAQTYPPSPASAAVHLQALPQSPSHTHSTLFAHDFRFSPHPSRL